VPQVVLLPYVTPIAHQTVGTEVAPPQFQDGYWSSQHDNSCGMSCGDDNDMLALELNAPPTATLKNLIQKITTHVEGFVDCANECDRKLTPLNAPNIVYPGGDDDSQDEFFDCHVVPDAPDSPTVNRLPANIDDKTAIGPPRTVGSHTCKALQQDQGGINASRPSVSYCASKVLSGSGFVILMFAFLWGAISLSTAVPPASTTMSMSFTFETIPYANTTPFLLECDCC
jgi:hypothetical protein